MQNMKMVIIEEHDFLNDEIFKVQSDVYTMTILSIMSKDVPPKMVNFSVQLSAKTFLC